MEISDGNPKLKQTDCWALHIRQGPKRDLGDLWPSSTCFKTAEEKREVKVSTRELYRHSSPDRHQSGTCWSSASGTVSMNVQCLTTSTSLSAALEKLFSHAHTLWRGELLTNMQTVEEADLHTLQGCHYRAAFKEDREYPKLLWRVNKRL